MDSMLQELRMQGKFRMQEKLPEKLTMEEQLRMEEEVTRTGFERQLIEALRSEKEDCLVVLGLLRQDWSLLNDCEPERVLHLGVRRGCAELVEQVLRHLGVDITLSDKSKLPIIDEECISLSGNQGATTVVAPEHHDDAKTTQTDARSGQSDTCFLQSQRDVLEGIADKGTSSGPILDLKKKLVRLGSIHDQLQARQVVDYTALLLSKHEGLDLLARAVLNGNLEVLSLLFKRIRVNDQIGPYREELRTIARGVVAGIKRDPLSHESCKSILNSWRGNPEFNFLFWDFDLWEERVSEYLFHFLFTNGFKGKSLLRAELIRECIWLEVWKSPIPGGQPLWEALLRLHDAQGRTPLHVAVDEGTVSAFGDLFRAKIPDGKDLENAYRFAMMQPDGLGRTAWHRAVVLGDMNAMSAMVKPWSRFTREMLWQEPMCDPLHTLRSEGIPVGGIDLHEISVRNGFKGYRDSSSVTPLHSAILHQRTEILNEFATFSPFDPGFDLALAGRLYRVDTLELATLMGEASTVRRLLEDISNGKVQTGQRVRYGWLGECSDQSRLPWPTIHLAASSGNFEVLKAFIDRRDMCDPYIEDLPKRTVIHHAMKVYDLTVEPHLLDFASIKHFASHDSRFQLHDDSLERQGCINLLLQSGCEMFKADEDGQAPYPKGDLASDKEFLSWWYDKQSKEFNATQSAMISATNAISVMATLVATGAYVGPLQPPLGYTNGNGPGSGDGPGQLQATYIAVRIFIVCDTLSFYLAIAAITFSLIPCLPMPQQPMKDELERTRGMIILAVATLFPSIVCILIAFASSSIVVVSANGVSSPDGHLTLITAAIGGLICLIGFLFLLIRLLGIIFPRNRWIRIIYDWISSILQWRKRTPVKKVTPEQTFF